MADEELKDLLKKNLEISQDSLRILKKINRARIWSGFFGFMKWVLIIGFSVGSYYYIEPYLKDMWGVFNTAVQTMNQIKKTGQQFGEIPPDVTDLLKNLKTPKK